MLFAATRADAIPKVAMEDDEYERICALREFPRGDSSDQRGQLSVSEENFLVIKRQAEHRRLRAALRLHRQDKTLKRYIARHGLLPSAGKSLQSDGSGNAGKSNETICSIAKSVDFSPCMLARVMLEAKYGWSKTTISNLFKDVMNGTKRWPIRLPSHEFRSASSGDRKEMAEQEYQRLWREVEECIHHDPFCSPLADRIRHNMGLENEYILITKLRSRGLLFESEDALRYVGPLSPHHRFESDHSESHLTREKGLSKTPDVRLLLPIGVRDTQGKLHIVNWIDSKAMFGDRHTHETENAGQVHPPHSSESCILCSIHSRQCVQLR
jgi:hypothetical protein